MSDQATADEQMRAIIDDLASEAWRCGTNDEGFDETNYWMDEARKQLRQLLLEAQISELQYIKDLDEPADYEQGGKNWTGLAIPRNKIIDRIAQLNQQLKEES